jgi:hypothetical protein
VKDFPRREHVGAEQELARLVRLELAEEVAPERHAHAGRTGQLQRAAAGVEHQPVLLQALGAHSEAGGMPVDGVVGDQRRDQERPPVGQELRGGRVDEVPVLDDPQAALDRPRHRLGRIRVGADVALEAGRLLDRRPDLVERVLEAVEQILGRGDAAGDHDLDVVGALAELLG